MYLSDALQHGQGGWSSDNVYHKDEELVENIEPYYMMQCESERTEVPLITHLHHSVVHYFELRQRIETTDYWD